MTGSLWKRNNGDEEEGAAQSSPESDASASGGSSRSDRSGGDDDHGPPRSSRLPTKTSFPQISLKDLVLQIYDEHKHLWTKDRREQILAFGQKPSVAAGSKMRRKIGGEAGIAMGKEITALLHQSQQFSNIMTLINIRTTGPFQIPEKLLKEVVSKAPEEERVKTTYTLVDKLESVITKSRNYAKSHRELLKEIAATISGGTKDIVAALKKALDNAKDWAANIDTLVKTGFKDFLASIPKGETSVFKAIATAQSYANNIQVYASLLEKHYDKFVLMIQDPTKAEQLGQKVEEVPHISAPLKRKGGVKGRPTSASH
ncbi:hypothetical protein BSLG_009283 [Batrachochytrium salamandrivorans]|nr:hypothetical protein BSLG_009283 [Batrachochytrium salamandrivorans]